MAIKKEIDKFLKETDWKKQICGLLQNPKVDTRLIPQVSLPETAIMEGIRLILRKLNEEK